MRLIALVDVDTALGDVGWKESPALFADAESFVALGFAVSVGAALDILARSLARQSRRCADEPSVALALERSGDVQADRVLATNVFVRMALINVHTHRARSLEALLTEALTFDAFSVVRAVEVAVAQDVDIGLFAGDFRIGLGSITLRADTVITRRGVLADCIIAARFLQGSALIDIDAASEGIAGAVRLAGA